MGNEREEGGEGLFLLLLLLLLLLKTHWQLMKQKNNKKLKKKGCCHELCHVLCVCERDSCCATIVSRSFGRSFVSDDDAHTTLEYRERERDRK